VIIDTTYDAVMRDKPEFNGFEKNNSAYKAARVY
jgi:hypothetical protein